MFGLDRQRTAAAATAPRQVLRRNVLEAVSAVLLCAGLVLLPGLAALDLSVGLACQGLSRNACIALFQPSPE